MFLETTNYSFVDEFNKKSTISLPKLTADVLQTHIIDVHDWIQRTYESVLERMPDKSRRYRGNVVRVLSEREAQKHSMYYKLIEINL